MRIFRWEIPTLGRAISSTGLLIVLVFIIGIAYTLHKLPSTLSVASPTQSSTSLLANAESANSTATTSTESTSKDTQQIAQASTTTASTSTAPTPTAPIATLGSPSATPAPTTPTTNASTQSRGLTTAGGKLLASLVNIVCISSDNSIPSISGSGVMIDSRGIILTAAHVAQLFLLQDYLGSSKVQCIIRAGSPARRAYSAEPIYVSKSWIMSNPTTLTSSAPLGTGQNDVALLGITGTATSTPLPSSFPSIPLAPANPQLHDEVAIGSYGAQYLSSSELNYSLYPIIVFGTIQNRYTFVQGTVDLISVAGSAASQEGSSGGGMANALGQLVGTITTSSISGSFATRQLNAITPSHLRSTYETDMGQNLDATLQGQSVSALIAGFAAESKTLGAQLNQYVTSK